MAEGLDDQKVYLTRSRKRSMECPEPKTPPHDAVCLNEVIDLTNDEDTVDAPQALCDVETPALECAICLQTCIHPARLPCGHIFCFLCVKGAAHGNRKCAMCRSPIPHNYFNNPDLMESPEELACSASEEYEWFYEGRNGWWQYDPRASRELESAWASGLLVCELLIAGYLYIIDFRDMCQIRKRQPSKIRRIKRDFASVEKLGVAGLRGPHRPPLQRRRSSESDKGRTTEPGEAAAPPPPTPGGLLSRSTTALDSVSTHRPPPPSHFLHHQMAELSLNSDDDDSYQ